MKILIVEDDFISRQLLQKLLSQYGTCDIAVNGLEAVEAFKMAYEEEKPYDLVCLDIMMPGMDGQEVLKRIRAYERQHQLDGMNGTKIVITTALDDFNNVKTAFREQCEAYIVKPISKENLLKALNQIELLSNS